MVQKLRNYLGTGADVDNNSGQESNICQSGPVSTFTPFTTTCQHFVETYVSMLCHYVSNIPVTFCKKQITKKTNINT